MNNLISKYLPIIEKCNFTRCGRFIFAKEVEKNTYCYLTFVHNSRVTFHVERLNIDDVKSNTLPTKEAINFINVVIYKSGALDEAELDLVRAIQII